MRPIVIWGATGQARVLAEFLPAIGFQIAALIDRDPAIASFLANVPLFRDARELAAWRRSVPGDVAALVAIGGSHGIERLALQDELAAAGYDLPAAVHPRAYVAGDARIGPGSQVLAMAVVGAGAQIGAACIVNTAASVDHECVLEDGVHIAPGASIAGLVHVGRGAFVGTGASIIPRVRVGAQTTIGAGAVVVRDIPAHSIAYGNPARVIRRAG